MSLPVTIDPSLPPDSETPQAGALRIRNLTQALVDLFGLPTAPTPITGALFATSASGQVSFAASPPGALFTNKTGVTLSAGSVVALDATNDRAVALSDVSGSLAQFVVSQGTLAFNADGGFSTQGLCAITGVTGAIVRGNYLRKSATTLLLEDTGVAEASATAPPTGSVAVALQNAAGPGAATIVTYLLGSTWPGNTFGVLSAQVGPVGTPANTADTTLFSFALPAGLINTVGFGVRIRAYGIFAANANLKTIRLKFGAMEVADSQSVSNALRWTMEAVIQRVTNVTQVSSGTTLIGEDGVDAALSGRVRSRQPVEDLSTSITVAVSGQNGTAVANDIVCRGFIVDTFI